MAAAAAGAGVGGGGGGEGSSSSPAGVAIGQHHHGSAEEAMWQMTLGGGESMEPGPYPERIGEPDCSYYMRTGLCRFGMTCKFNHPPNRKLAVAAARMKGEYPYRVGQPECQYYLKTGTCKFGATCKFHHPREKAAIATRVQLNVLGYPLRPNEKECTYYLRTGQCKFASTCKFHHPQPSNTMVAVRGSVYSPMQSATSPGEHTYPGAVTNWTLSRSASFIASPRWPGHSGYAQVIVPQGLVQVPGWNPYAAQMGSSSPDDQQRTPGTTQYYTGSHQGETTGMGEHGMFPSYQAGSVPVGLYAVQSENIFPERPDQPECQFYTKTGDCKFGAVCKFNHPKERLIPAPNCALSPLGLPLRPVVMLLLTIIFAVFHSGMANVREPCEKIIGERAYRVLFAGISLPLAVTTIVYFINHRYDGTQLWQVQDIFGIHELVWLSSFISFFFLYPSTFNLLEVAAVDKPKLHMWETGIMRITRHPQMVGQVVWCLAHTLWIGSSVAVAASVGLIGHHLYGAWNGDRRLASRYGEAFEVLKKRTSVVPFAAIVDGQQKLPKDYYKEFFRLPYVAITALTLGAYFAHPLMQASSYQLPW